MIIKNEIPEKKYTEEELLQAVKLLFIEEVKKNMKLKEIYKEEIGEEFVEDAMRKQAENKLKDFYEQMKYLAGFFPPHPIDQEWLQKAYSAGLIPKDKLEVGVYYYGHCRNAYVAMWNGTDFVYMRKKFCDRFPDKLKCPEDDDGFDLFIAVQKIITPTDDEKINGVF